MTMDLRSPTTNITGKKMKTLSLGSGALSPSPSRSSSKSNNNKKKKQSIVMRSSVKSLAIGKLSKGSPSRAAVQKLKETGTKIHHNSCELNAVDSVGSTAEDSYQLPGVDMTSHGEGSYTNHHDSCDDFDPYLGNRRSRSVKDEPYIPRCCDPLPSSSSSSPPQPLHTATSGESTIRSVAATDMEGSLGYLSPTSQRIKSILSSSLPTSYMPQLPGFLSPRSFNWTTSGANCNTTAEDHKDEDDLERPYNPLLRASVEQPNQIQEEDGTPRTKSLVGGGSSPSGLILWFEPNKQETKSQKAQAYWKSQIAKKQKLHGRIHPQTAKAYYSWGHAFMNDTDSSPDSSSSSSQSLDDACVAFETATQIWKEYYGPKHLSVALALDAHGYAMMMKSKKGKSGSSSSSSKNKKKLLLYEAKSLLDEAFAIRYKQLGVWHVDTVETYNKIAGIHLLLGNYQDALSHYEEIYLVRKAIFGSTNHPSVAITAHTLANVNLKLCRPDDAKKYYDLALQIYNQMNLSSNHPTVAKLLKDRSSLERSGILTSSSSSSLSPTTMSTKALLAGETGRPITTGTF